MKFYSKQHAFYCGIDLHARTMYLCIVDADGEVHLHRNYHTRPDLFLRAIAPYREDLVVAVECIFTWYWIADLCATEGIDFVLGHALYMKAIHGGKAKNDRIDAEKIAMLLRGGLIPVAYVYPPKMRSTRDLLRRRMHLMRKRAELLAHIQNTSNQYNLPHIQKKLGHRCHREGIAERFPDTSVRRSIEVDLALIDFYDKTLKDLELYIIRSAKEHDCTSLHLLRTVPGIGKILSLLILYEIHDIHRFERVQDFVSYCRLVKCAKESAGKKHGSSGKKIGNAHLKWAFSEATVLFLRNNPRGKKYLSKIERKHCKAKALSVLAHKLARAVYYMLRREKPFDLDTFLGQPEKEKNPRKDKMAIKEEEAVI